MTEAAAEDVAVDAQPGFERDALLLARVIFARDGKIDPRRVLVDGGSPERFANIPLPTAPPGMTDPFIKAVRRMLAVVKAQGVAVIAETWMLHLEPGEDRDSLPVDFSTDPRALEFVVVIVEHHALGGGMTRSWNAKINRDADGTATLAPFERQPGIPEGRMVGLLSPKEIP